jgi:hypothetical protein
MKDAFRRMTRQLQTGNEQVEPISRVTESIVRLSQLFLMPRLRKARNLVCVFCNKMHKKKTIFWLQKSKLSSFFSYFEGSHCISIIDDFYQITERNIDLFVRLFPEKQFHKTGPICNAAYSLYRKKLKMEVQKIAHFHSLICFV